MTQEDHEKLLRNAEKAVAHARDVRIYHRKRTRIGHAQRNADIGYAMQTIKHAMRPIRSVMGRAPYVPITETSKKRHAELRKVSRELQAERRKLWKLRGGRNHKYRSAKRRRIESAA